MRNPYSVLGVETNATGDEIKAAFRKNAKACHPDHNQNEPGAAERFTDINRAYEILGDARKRRQFDQGQIDANGRATRRKSMFSGWAGFGFKRKNDPKSESYASDSGETPREEQAGGKKQETHDEVMERIFGESSVRKNVDDAPGLDEHPEPDAHTHDIHADIMIPLESVLKATSQTVELADGRTVKVNVPAGVEEGRVLRLHGKGREQGDGNTGDLLITVRYRKHKMLRPDGADLIADLPVSLRDGILGAKIPFEALDGRLLVTVPPWSGSDKILRIRGKGLPDSHKKRGDLLINIRLLLPEDTDETLLAYAKTGAQ